jgi:hypothetical protein
VLDMTVEDAQEFFKAVPAIRDKMDALMRVGLGYIKVGQQATTLSGGEAQRVKLSPRSCRANAPPGRTLYILDEPTTGLHFEDVRKLLEVLHELVDQGNTVVVIEHNLDVIKTADWIIDIGPEGGDGGGEIVATGTGWSAPPLERRGEAADRGREHGRSAAGLRDGAPARDLAVAALYLATARTRGAAGRRRRHGRGRRADLRAGGGRRRSAEAARAG